jgi:polysaccharide deacetylase 2 family uncharacterized protein YibQ
LALAASLAVLAAMLFGPFPSVPFERKASVAKTENLRPHAAASSKAHAKPQDHAPLRDTEAPSHRGELPFEEHLASRGAPSGSSGLASVRMKVEPPAPIMPAAAGSADVEPTSPVIPGDAEKGPRMVVVIDDMGDHPVLAKNLMELPFPVTLAILPHRPRTKAIEALAVEHGTEIILHQPMQPGSYPRVNPGPGAVFIDMDAVRIKTLVSENLAQLPHVVGVNNHMGSAFTSDTAGMEAVMPVLKSKGLFFLDSVTSPVSAAPEAARKAGVRYYRRAVFLDNVRNVRAILGQLKTAERHALKTGRAIAIGHPYGETLDALRAFAKERDGRVAIVSLTELGPEF